MKMSMNNKYFSIISKTKEELDIEKELVNNIKNDKNFVDEVIRPLKISHELFMDYLFAFVDAQKEFHNCKNCQGFDKCPNAHKGMRAILTNDKKFVSTILSASRITTASNSSRPKWFMAKFRAFAFELFS